MEFSKVRINEDKNRFELELDGYTAFIDYRKSNQVYTLTHTEVPKALEGKGVGKELVKQSLAYLQDNSHTLIPLCPFVTAYLKRNPESKTLLEKGYIVNLLL